MWIRIGRFLLVTWFGCLVAGSCAVNGFAEDISIDATVNTNKVSLQDYVQFTLTIHGFKGDLSTVPMPVVEGFETRYLGPQTRFTIINGVSSSEHSFVYSLFPSKSGHFEIPSLTLTLDGKTYATSPISIDVMNNPKKDDSSGDINDKVFLKASIEPKEVYVGQKIPLNMKVFVTDISLQLAAAPYLTPKGFTADKTASMLKSREVINGISYETMTFHANIYPIQSGDLDVGPFQAMGELLYRSKQTDDILGNFLSNSVESRPITLHAPVISIHVLDLPEENKPKNFSGAVGQYDFQVTVSPSSVKLGDPLTLHMAIKGDGQLKELQFPVLSDDHFKLYDPQIKDNEDSKTLDQVIIPTDQRVTKVPAISFNYFDPKEKQYKTITQGPFFIKVTPPGADQEFKAYGFVDKTKSVDKNLVVKLDWIGRFIERWVGGLKAAIKDWHFWASMLLIFVVWFAWRLWQKFQKKFENDQAFARRWQAESKAKELLKATKGYLQQKDARRFYSSVYEALSNYLADKMHMPIGALSWAIIETRLKERSMDSTKLQALESLFERCDLVRFASATISADQMQQDYDQLDDLIAYLPKILK